MTYSGRITRTVSTPNSDPRAGGAVPRYIVHHHMATTGFSGVLESWRTGKKQGSAHAAIDSDGETVGVVPEERRAWSLSSESFDSQALVTEIANSSVGGSWPVSAAAHEAAAQLTADWCTRYGIPCDRTHIIGHREVFTRFGKGYATACPGGLDLDGIVARARVIMGQPGAPAPRPSAPTSSAPAATSGGWALNLPASSVQATIQRGLTLHRRYSGPVDGALGVNGFKGIQTTIKNVGYTGPVDGDIGANGCRFIQVYAAKWGGYSGPIDSILGPNSWAGFAAGVSTP